MKHTDDKLKDIFSKKLGGYESPVSTELWTKVSSQLPTTSGVSGTAAAVKTVSTKLIWAVAAAVVTVATIVSYGVLSDDGGETKPSNVEATSPTNAAQENTTQAIPAAVDKKGEIVQKETGIDTKNELLKSSISKNKDGIEQKSKQLFEIQKSTTSENPPQRSNTVLPSTSQTGIAVQQAPQHAEEQIVSTTIAPIRNPDLSEKEQEMTALYTIAPINKSELCYFFMPQYTDATSYLWEFDGNTTSDKMSPTHTFDEEGIHKIKLTVLFDNHSKTYTETIAIYRPGVIEVPNVFTPNGDGFNDYFDILEKSVNVKFKKIIVMNQNGVVFESEENMLWDGNDIYGNPLPSGEYQYFISAIDKEGTYIEKKGFVSVKR